MSCESKQMLLTNKCTRLKMSEIAFKTVFSNE